MVRCLPDRKKSFRQSDSILTIAYFSLISNKKTKLSEYNDVRVKRSDTVPCLHGDG